MYSQLACLLDLGMLVEEFPSSLFIPSSIFFLIAFRMCTSETEMEEVRERVSMGIRDVEVLLEEEGAHMRNRVNYIYKGAKKREWDAEAI